MVRLVVDNIAWMDLGDCAEVVYALENAHLESKILDAIASTMGDKPVRYVLNTHTRGDRVALNGAFKRRFNAEIVNQRTRTVGPEGKSFEGAVRRVEMMPMGAVTPTKIAWSMYRRIVFCLWAISSDGG